MTARLLEGKVFAQKIKDEAREEALALRTVLGRMPGLAVVIVGEDPASEVYVRNKERACEALGFFSALIALPKTTTKEDLLAEIDRLNASRRIDGILVQLPLPAHLAKSAAEIIERIDPKKDVDGFHPINIGRLVAGEKALVPCTPAGCMKMLKLAGIPVAGKRACVIGRSNIVGKPISHLLQRMRRSRSVTRARKISPLSHARRISSSLPSVSRAS